MTELTTEASVPDLLGLISKLEKNTGQNLFKIGEAYCIIKERGLKEWKRALGSHISNWTDFCRELGRSESSVKNYMNVYKVYFPLFCIDGGEKYLQIPYTHLIRLLPIMNDVDTEDAETHLESALHLKRVHDVEQYVRGVQGKVVNEQCDHPEAQMVRWAKCKKCGTTIR